MESREDKLKKKIRKLGQFPYMRRRTNYQSYCIGNHYENGSRDTLYRMDAMGIPVDLTGKSVLDLGCQIGAICTEVYIRGAKEVIGLDYREDYIYCAKELAEYNKHKIEYTQMDLCDTYAVIDYLNGKSFDIIFLLSMYKHLKGKGFDLLEKLKWKVVYIESNNCSNGYVGKQAKEMSEYMKNTWDNLDLFRLGIIEDRGRRCLWKLY